MKHCYLFLLLAALEIPGTPALMLPRRMRQKSRGGVITHSERALFQLDVPLGDEGTAKMKFKPTLGEGSTAVVVRYPIPFGLDAEPKVRSPNFFPSFHTAIPSSSLSCVLRTQQKNCVNRN